MPQSLAQLYVHLVFSTKNREPWLSPAIRPRVHAYLAEVCNSCDCPALIVGGVADHVHILARFGRKLSVADWIGTLKADSSKWIKGIDPRLNGFAWQAGYGAFSVSPSHVEAVTEYIRNQEEHHRMKNFQEEFRELLKKYGLEGDERYLWD